MKRDLLKFKLAVIALALVSAYQPNMSAVHSAGQAQTQSENEFNEFIESMFVRIKDSVNAIIDLVESFIDKNNKESYSAFIKRCKERLELIDETILKPLQAELNKVKATHPGSNYHKILEKTYNVAFEMAHKELKGLHTILENHKKSPDVKKALTLATSLKPYLTRLTSVATLDTLEKHLTEIQNLLLADHQMFVAEEIENLKQMIKEIRIKTASIQNKVNVEILTIISARLKKL